MGHALFVLVWIMNFGISIWNAYAVGKVWVESKHAGGWHRFMAWIGFLSFGMIGALVSRFAAFVTRAQACPDVPACNWHVYVGVGGLIGAISLPWLVVGAMGKPKKTT